MSRKEVARDAANVRAMAARDGAQHPKYSRCSGRLRSIAGGLFVFRYEVIAMVDPVFYLITVWPTFDNILRRLIGRDFPSLKVILHNYDDGAFRYSIYRTGVKIVEIDIFATEHGRLEVQAALINPVGDSFLIALYKMASKVIGTDLDIWVNRARSHGFRFMLADFFTKHPARGSNEETRRQAFITQVRAGLQPVTEMKPEYTRDAESLQVGGTEAKAAIPTNKRGRPRGSLSSNILTAGATVDDIKDLLPMLYYTHQAKDGSFQALCKEKDIPESTALRWLKNYWKP